MSYPPNISQLGNSLSRSVVQPHSFVVSLLNHLDQRDKALNDCTWESSILKARITPATSGSRVWPVLLRTIKVLYFGASHRHFLLHFCKS